MGSDKGREVVTESLFPFPFHVSLKWHLLSMSLFLW